MDTCIPNLLDKLLLVFTVLQQNELVWLWTKQLPYFICLKNNMHIIDVLNVWLQQLSKDNYFVGKDTILVLFLVYFQVSIFFSSATL